MRISENVEITFILKKHVKQIFILIRYIDIHETIFGPALQEKIQHVLRYQILNTECQNYSKVLLSNTS